MLQSNAWTEISLNTAWNKIDTTVSGRIMLSWNIQENIVARWACVPSKALITDDMRETESGSWLQSMINTNDQQQVGCFSLGQRKKSHMSIRMSSCTFLDFRQRSDSAVRDCSLVKRMKSWNRSYCSPARRRSLQAPAQILSSWPQRWPFSRRVTWRMTILTSKRRFRAQ